MINKNKNNYKLVLLGDTAVGKSCIAMRYVNDDFYEFQEPTIGAAFLSKHINIKNNDTRLDIWDTAGQERYRSLAPMYYRGAQAAIVIYDITMNSSFNGAKSWIKELKSKTTNCYIVLLGNKCDLEKNRRVNNEEVENFCLENNIKHILTSAKTGENVETVFKTIIENLPEKIIIENTVITSEFDSTNKKSCC